jgi:hypothetical protein
VDIRTTDNQSLHRAFVPAISREGEGRAAIGSLVVHGCTTHEQQTHGFCPTRVGRKA